jgi:hypothetical protein
VAIVQPALQLRVADAVNSLLAFAEQQPVAGQSRPLACAQVRAQAGQAGTVADVNGRHVRQGRGEGGIGLQAQADGRARRGEAREPAGSEAVALIVPARVGFRRTSNCSAPSAGSEAME